MLTPRERDVASRIARGLSNRQIADELVIALGTTERHVANILSKLDMRSQRPGRRVGDAARPAGSSAVAARPPTEGARQRVARHRAEPAATAAVGVRVGGRLLHLLEQEDDLTIEGAILGTGQVAQELVQVSW